MDTGFPERRHVTIRDLDVATFKRLRAERDRRRWTYAAVIEHIVREWDANLAANGPAPVARGAPQTQSVG